MTQQTVVVKAAPRALVSWFSSEIAKAQTEGGAAGGARLAHVHKVAEQVKKAGAIYEDDGGKQTTISIEMLTAYAPLDGKTEGLTVASDQTVAAGNVGSPPDGGAATGFSANSMPAAQSGQSAPGSTSVDAPAITATGEASYLMKMAEELIGSLGPCADFLAPGAVMAKDGGWPLDMNEPGTFASPGAVSKSADASTTPDVDAFWGKDAPEVRGAL